MTEEMVLSLERNGFIVLPLLNKKPLLKLQKVVRSFFDCEPDEWHNKNVNQDDHISLVKEITDKISESGLTAELIRSNVDTFIQLLGPDIDIQIVPHLRISRPQKESDLINWHRDTFYGNLPWEMNLWFPLFPLHSGAGLRILAGSHLKPSMNIREVKDTDPFRSTVIKGSLANQIGYLYSPKTDDTIANMKLSQAKLISPQVGAAILFFGYMVHKAENTSTHTRISIDLRIRNAHTKTNTKEGYYKPLSRGLIDRCVSQFLSKI